MEKYFSPMLAYKKRYSTQHVPIRLLDEWRNKLDNNLFVEVLVDLSKASDGIAHDLNKAKMVAYGIKMKLSQKMNNNHNTFK